MDLTAENVRAIFLDSLSLDAEASPAVAVRGLANEYALDSARLQSHLGTIRSFLGRVSTRFYMDRGGGFSCAFLAYRRDGTQWGDYADMEHLLVLGLGLGLVEFCFKRRRWHLFPQGMPYVRIASDLFKLYATFRRRLSPSGEPASEDTVQISFDPEAHPPPRGIEPRDWYRPATFSVADLSNDASHLATAFYNSVVIDGFFSNNLPSWILDPDTTLDVY